MSEEQEKPQEDVPVAEGGGQEQPPGAEAPGTAPESERSMATLCHILAIFTGFLGPLIIWLVKKDESPFVDDQGKEALNFQITIAIAGFVGAALTAVFIGCFIVAAVVVCDILFCILGAAQANKGERYRYPVCIRFIK
ncbi:MAG: DUF4870 domain-containing protein [Candidatus Brocadiia bacterium]|jgi:hypothetical protein|nr:DUF4870 domain-containing protein [Candidatus Brocadiia bacterium]